MADQFTFVNFFTTELVVGVNVSDTVIVIPAQDSLEIPVFSSGFLLPLTLWDGESPPEIVYATNNPQTGSLTVTRGMEGTSAVGWSAGTQVRSIISAAVLNAALAAYNSGQVLIANYLPLSGGTLTGPLTLSGPPTTPLMAADKAYVDGSIGGLLPLSGGTMTGNLNMGSNRLIGLPDPTLLGSNDAATKGYALGLHTASQNTLADRSGILVTSGTGAAYTITSITGYATSLVDGVTIAARFHATNRANPTLALDGTAAIPLRAQTGVNLQPGVMAIGSIGIFEYHASVPEWLIIDMELPRTVTTTSGPSPYAVTTGLSLAALEDGLELLIQLNTASTGPVTLSVDGLGSIPLRPASGIEYNIGALAQYTVLRVRYNGTTSEWITEGAPPPPVQLSQLSFSDLTNVSLVATGNASGVLTVALKTISGSDASPTNLINIPFQDPGGSGVPVWRQLNSAISASVGANPAGGGYHFGQTGANVPLRLWVVVVDNAGTLILGLINCSLGGTVAGTGQIFPLDEVNPQSTSLLGIGSTSPGVVYTPGAALTGKCFRVLGYVEYSNGLAAPGAYTTNPTVKLFGAGVKKPGDVIQTVVVSSNTPTGNLTPTLTKINLTFSPAASIPVTNKCNPVKVRSDTSILTAGANFGNAGLFRTTNATPVGSFVSWAGPNAAQSPVISITFSALDFPAILGNQVYGVFGVSASGGASNMNAPFAGTTQPITMMTMEELQG